MNGTGDGMRGCRVPAGADEAGNRDEWRYYPEGLIVRSVGHVARMDFMRIDFYDDIAPRWPNGAHDQYRRDTLRDRWTKPGIPLQAAFPGNFEPTSRIVGHYDVIVMPRDIDWC
ncbi:hypothetical protein [Burkholderia sp. BCC1998]|uniref:hypothetical protein n=1 Tax=Burkholderia sp. BCC1998 TaxID=2817447 RepID=UPI002AB7BADB|nr:hypothetical protein [Burkholderia sp. BCC1998]